MFAVSKNVPATVVACAAVVAVVVGPGFCRGDVSGAVFDVTRSECQIFTGTPYGQSMTCAPLTSILSAAEAPQPLVCAIRAWSRPADRQATRTPPACASALRRPEALVLPRGPAPALARRPGRAHPIHGGTWWGAKIGTSTCPVGTTHFPVGTNRKNDGFELLSRSRFQKFNQNNFWINK